MTPDRYRRQRAFAKIGGPGQDAISRARLCIVGIGALGSVLAERLVRSGIGSVRLIDRDWVELDNLPRQTLFTESDAIERRPKAIAAYEALRVINSQITIEPHVIDLQPENAVNLVADCDLIIDGTDNFETRYLINDLSHEYDLPWVHGGIVGASGQVMAIVPGQTCCLRCILPDMPGLEATETCNTAGVLGPSVSIIASLQALLAIKMIISGRESIASEWHAVDTWELSFRKFRADPQVLRKHCPACNGARDFLSGRLTRSTEVLCGRNAVQIQSATRQAINPQELALKLVNEKVEVNPFFVRLKLENHELTVFRDGRTIVSGTEDPVEAKRLIAQWIGS